MLTKFQKTYSLFNQFFPKDYAQHWRSCQTFSISAATTGRCCRHVANFEISSTVILPDCRWRRERIENKKLALRVENEIYEYARSNLAIINIFIKEPYSKRFR